MPTRSPAPPRLLAVAHGTDSATGIATVSRLAAAIQAARPDVAVHLAFLDVAEPRLPDALTALRGAPAVVVPLLLSTGYHVESDIPAAIAHRPNAVSARHLGPDPLLTDVLVNRLGQLPVAASVALVGAGSSRDGAADELATAARLLGARLGRPVTGLTVSGGLRAALAALPPPVHVATYLLAEGQFDSQLRAAAAGVATVAPPLGVHPALVRLIWARYDEAVDFAAFPAR